jgi:hypothetical protein
MAVNNQNQHEMRDALSPDTRRVGLDDKGVTPPGVTALFR